ncbi:MAG: L-threonylcarbamoyladenylate synthase [Methanimicrococcus sp.]|nr:L-threonylcarbamoyladenylate synthase [Methanimicrococcus sp.]
MPTVVFPLKDIEEAVFKASSFLKDGKSAAFPTETVYGLGAMISNESAVLKIYEIKGRAPEKPLSVLISSAKDMEEIATDIPSAAFLLAERFWPGPMTLILKKKAGISNRITAGKDTVGLRVPAHPFALKLVQTVGPLACPSANLSNSKEPKSAADVLNELSGKIDLLIDGGETQFQKPSTIIDLTKEPPQILRVGGLDVSEIEKVIGGVIL